MTCDFFTPQHVTGARAYHMRNILHDYLDQKCIYVLRSAIATMGPESVIWTDETMLPNEKASRRATQIDLLMMSYLASIERDER